MIPAVLIVVVTVIDYLTKDLTTVTTGVVVHGCNCVGGFGSGVAGAIRRKWPDVYAMFKERGVGEDLLGGISMLISLADERPVVINGYTQLTCGNDGRRYADPDAVESVLMASAEFADTGDYKELYMPKIGCGLGGLSWTDEVLPIVEKVSQKFPDLNIHICDI